MAHQGRTRSKKKKRAEPKLLACPIHQVQIIKIAPVAARKAARPACRLTACPSPGTSAERTAARGEAWCRGIT
jgi:hypothetical protein